MLEKAYDSAVLVPARKLALNAGLWCIVDAVDYDYVRYYKRDVLHSRQRLSPTRWNAGAVSYRRNRRPLYVKTNHGTARTTHWLHRVLMHRIDPRPEWWEASHVVDHLNGQTLDNRRANLRWASHSENGLNQTPAHAVPTLAWIWANLCVDAEQQIRDMPF